MVGPSNIQFSTALLARLGYGARGVVYILVGGLAVLAALGPWGKTTGSKGAFLVVMEQPLGRIWLGLIGIGLGLFTLWRLAQSVLDADRLGNSLSKLGRRAAYLVSGIINAGLAFFAVTLALGLGLNSMRDEESSLDSWAYRLMSLPYGNWLVMTAGSAVIGSGVFLLWQAWKGRRVERFLNIPPDMYWWIIPVGRVGFAGRGVVFVLIGSFLAFAGLHGRSDDVRGVAGAFRTLAALPYGWLLLALTATALMAFGTYGIIQAVYRRIRPPELPGES